ncbi:MAG: bifunctional phosphoribosylaminoimidazolecarboxamide formyltransferase/IMP cyclohydrolase [Candidatus Bilamarchaeaceae archaeon]
MQKRLALLSVYDKEGIVEFARFLSQHDFEILSSGGSSKALQKAGVGCTEVSDFTGFPEMMGGRVKTLHPKIHGGILANRKDRKHAEDMQKNGIRPIDLVAVNLYPFESATGNPNCPLEEAIENIDIGGPTLLRAAAKNYRDVIVIPTPSRYKLVMEEISSRGEVSEETRQMLAVETFMHISHYDVLIESWLRRQFLPGQKTPEYLNLTFQKVQDLRYGENPHQHNAALYREPSPPPFSVAASRQLQGKELSFNNILDINAAFALTKEFGEPTVVIVKHNNPCGVATNPDLAKAYDAALAVDSESAFGGIVSVNRRVEEEFAKKIISRFYEVVVAPSFSKEALAVLSTKKNLRAIEMGDARFPIKRAPFTTYRSVLGGLLVQDGDNELYDPKALRVVSRRQPTPQEMDDMLYAWTICKFVKSNAIVYARNKQAVGIGAGQMKRVDAARLAAQIAEAYGASVKGCAMASDAFFPFRDGIDAAAKRGVTAVIQPGGSIRDEEVIKAADEHGMAMVFTGMRHFRH